VVLSKAAEGLVNRCGWHGMQGVRGSNPLSSTSVISQEIGITRTRSVGSGRCCFGLPWVDGLVVAGGVDDQLAEQLAGGRVDDADLEVVDEQPDGGSGVGSADADVVEAAVDPQVTLPSVSMRSCRTRSWVSWSRPVAGVALGRAWQATAGVARPGRDRWGRWWL
jgi:hypothetical protein